MNSIISQSIPLKDVIKDISEELNARVTTYCNEHTVHIPKNYGTGTIKGINFKNGLGIILYDCTFHNDLEIQFIVDDVHPIKFLFCEEGRLTHHFEHEVKDFSMERLQNIIVASCEKKGHILHFKGGTKTVLKSLEINRREFLKKMKCEMKTMGPQLQTLFRDEKAKAVFRYNGDYCLKLANLFLDINASQKNNFSRRLLLEGSALQILNLQLQQFEDDRLTLENRSVLRTSEMLLIEKATDLINDDILNFEGVEKLSQIIGVNINKLQQGFKIMHHNTVNGYVKNRRLDLGNNLLKNSEYTISEIVDIIGLSSKSYFSKIFKEKYGVSPSSFRKKVKNRKISNVVIDKVTNTSRQIGKRRL